MRTSKLTLEPVGAAPCRVDGGNAVPSEAAMTESTATAPRTTRLDLEADGYRPLLEGPPATAGMRSGFVTLAPGKSVGKHSTEQNEELLVVLEGQGEMTFKGGSKLPVKSNSAVYCPPQTEHNVTNTGTDALRYVYIVSNAS